MCVVWVSGSTSTAITNKKEKKNQQEREIADTILAKKRAEKKVTIEVS